MRKKHCLGCCKFIKITVNSLPCEMCVSELFIRSTGWLSSEVLTLLGVYGLPEGMAGETKKANKCRGNNKQRYKSAGSEHEYLMEDLDMNTRKDFFPFICNKRENKRNIRFLNNFPVFPPWNYKDILAVVLSRACWNRDNP